MVSAPGETGVKVWDPWVRIFHWSLVLGFFTAYLSGEGPEQLHEAAGYTVLGLVAFRLLWGVVGSRHARFTDFVRGPRAVMRYLAAVLRGRPSRFLGHNPAGGWMVIALLAVLALVCWSGLETLAAEGEGPLARSDVVLNVAHANGREAGEEHHGEDAEEFWEEVHEALSEFTLLLVAIHVLGVVVTSVIHRENLARAMVTGIKRAPDEHAAPGGDGHDVSP